MNHETTQFEKPGMFFPGMDQGASQQFGPGMFPDLTARKAPATPEEMEAEAEAARYEKKTVVKEFHTDTYDLSIPEDVKRYKADTVKLYAAFSLKRAELSWVDKRLVVHPGEKARMIVHVEWYEYDVTVTDHMTGERYDTIEKFLEHKAAEKARAAAKSHGTAVPGKPVEGGEGVQPS